jgi:hypothetical protein
VSGGVFLRSHWQRQGGSEGKTGNQLSHGNNPLVVLNDGAPTTMLPGNETSHPPA